jgi:hypothetical protein
MVVDENSGVFASAFSEVRVEDEEAKRSDV